MATLINLFVFLAFKFTEAFVAYRLMLSFKVEHDFLIFIFYGALSLFQLLFFFLSNLPQRENHESSPALLRNTGFFTFLIGMFTMAACLVFLYVRVYPDNPAPQLLYLFSATTLIGMLFYAVHSLTYGMVIQKRKVLFVRHSPIPRILFVFFASSAPAGYFGTKFFYYYNEWNDFDSYLLLGMLAVSFLSYTLMVIERSLRAHQTVKSFNHFDLETGHFEPFVNDANEFGYIQSSVFRLQNGLSKDKAALSLLSGYLSENIQSEMQSHKPKMNGEVKNACVLVLSHEFKAEGFLPEEITSAMKRFITMVGGFATEYDAYPFFSPHKAILVFGVPFYYEHQRLNAVECVSTILSHTKRLEEELSVSWNLHSGLSCGPVYTAALPVKGKELLEFSVFGESIDRAQKISAVARKLNEAFLADEETVKDLKTKFYIDKAYRTKLSENETLLLNRVRL